MSSQHEEEYSRMQLCEFKRFGCQFSVSEIFIAVRSISAAFIRRVAVNEETDEVQILNPSLTVVLWKLYIIIVYLYTTKMSGKSMDSGISISCIFKTFSSEVSIFNLYIYNAMQ